MLALKIFKQRHQRTIDIPDLTLLNPPNLHGTPRANRTRQGPPTPIYQPWMTYDTPGSSSRSSSTPDYNLGTSSSTDFGGPNNAMERTLEPYFGTPYAQNPSNSPSLNVDDLRNALNRAWALEHNRNLYMKRKVTTSQHGYYILDPIPSLAHKFPVKQIVTLGHTLDFIEFPYPSRSNTNWLYKHLTLSNVNSNWIPIDSVTWIMKEPIPSHTHQRAINFLKNA